VDTQIGSSAIHSTEAGLTVVVCCQSLYISTQTNEKLEAYVQKWMCCRNDGCWMVHSHYGYKRAYDSLAKLRSYVKMQCTGAL